VAIFIQLQALGNGGGACYIPPTHLAILPMTPTECFYLISVPIAQHQQQIYYKKTKICHPNRDLLHT